VISGYFTTITNLSPSVDNTYIKAEYNNFFSELKQLNTNSLSIMINNYYFTFYCSNNVSVPINSGITLSSTQINTGLSILQNIYTLTIKKFFDSTIQNIYEVATSPTTFYTSTTLSKYSYYQVLYYPNSTISITDNVYFTSIKNYIDIIILYLNNSTAVFNYSQNTPYITRIGNPSN